PRRGCRPRPGHRPAGTSFWGDLLREVRRRTAQDLVLLLQLAVAPLELTQFGGLLARPPRPHTVVDVGGLEPVTKTGLGDSEVFGDLGDRAALTGHSNHVTTELGGIRLGHGEHPSSADQVRTDQESTDAGALPTAYTLRAGDDVYSELGSWHQGVAHLQQPFFVDVALAELTP